LTYDVALPFACLGLFFILDLNRIWNRIWIIGFLEVASRSHERRACDRVVLGAFKLSDVLEMMFLYNLPLGKRDTIHIILISVLAVAYLSLGYKLTAAVKDIPLGRTVRYNSRPMDEYSFIGVDRPRVLLEDTLPVRMVVEETVHYSLHDPGSQNEWLWTAPVGDNYIRYGPEWRAFIPAMFHELHCLRTMQTALQQPRSKRYHPAIMEHSHHCFTYLIQWTLCSADVTLEPGDFTQRDFATERFGATHTCRDWQSIYDETRSRWREWKSYQMSHNSTS